MPLPTASMLDIHSGTAWAHGAETRQFTEELGAIVRNGMRATRVHNRRTVGVEVVPDDRCSFYADYPQY